MKQLLTIILFLTWMVGMGQTIQELHKQYISYCNEIVTDTVEEYGEVEATKEVPIYDGCEQIIGYRSIPAKDTTWKGYKCPEYKVAARGYWLTDTLQIVHRLDYWVSLDSGALVRKSVVSCKVSRKHVCNVKRDKPSHEGFYEWLWKYLSNLK